MKKEVSALKIMKNHEHKVNWFAISSERSKIGHCVCRIIEFEKPGGGIAAHKCSYVNVPFAVIQCSIARQS